MSLWSVLFPPFSLEFPPVSYCLSCLWGAKECVSLTLRGGVCAVQALVSPDKAIVSIITITADVGTQVAISYDIRHIQSIEGTNLYTYERFAVGTLIFTTILFLFCLYRALQVSPYARPKPSLVS